MEKYIKQVDNDAYKSQKYESVEKFVSYFHQQRLVCEEIDRISQLKKAVKLLEIGSGSAFLKSYIMHQYPHVEYKVMDIASDLSPDYLGDMTRIDTIVHEKFDIVCAFQVLEHVEYADAISVIEKVRRLTDVMILSLPHVRLYLSMRMKISVLAPLNVLLWLPFPKKHLFDGQHYWELGTKGNSLKGFRKDVVKHFHIQSEFSDNLYPWHRFFVLKKEG